MGKNNDTVLVIDALSMAIKNKPRQQQVLLHSDQGSTYRAYSTIGYYSPNDYEQAFYKENYPT